MSQQITAIEEKTKTVISRHWDKPEITVRITNIGIGIEMNVDDMLKALVEEMGTPAFMFTKDVLKEKLIKAMRSVEQKVKEASNYV